MIKIAPETITHEDVDALREWLGSYPRLTQGDKVKELENKFRDYTGRHCVMVNSGSSALLLALSVLQQSIGRRDLKIVVPAVGWATDLAPVMQLGMKPILCDCNMQDLSVDVDELQRVFEKQRPDCLILVSVVGLLPDMEKILNLCDFYDVFLIEDACESLGSKYGNRPLGTLGNIGVYSMYFSHQLSTIEGGMLVIDKLSYADKAKSMREFGWNRNSSEYFKNIMDKRHEIGHFESLFTFYYPGYNIRSTEVNAFIGLRQMDRLTKNAKYRNQLFQLYQKLLKDSLWRPKQTDDLVACMAYPVIVQNREKLVDNLESEGVETRPLVAGNLGLQPFYVNDHGIAIGLNNATCVANHGLYVPLHQDVTVEDVSRIVTIINNIGEPYRA